MKKQYTTPEMNIVNINLAIICVSFGEGETPIMHTQRYCGFLEDEEDDTWFGEDNF